MGTKKASTKKPAKVQLNITLAEVQEAKQELGKYLQPSPLLFNSWLSELFNCEIFLKLENMQPIGSFKIRGAAYKISKLTRDQKKRGVIAASAGNHAQGVAWGSRQLGVNSLIVMPEGAPIVKIQNTKALGAKVILQGSNYDECYQFAHDLAKKNGRVFVHAFVDEAVIAGQGTIGLEILEQLPDVEYVFGAVGGGGLMAGVASVLKELKPSVTLVGCQAAGASAMFDSIRDRKPIQLKSVETFADGIAVGRSSDLMRKILAAKVDAWAVVDEQAIAAAVLMLMEKAKIVTEGAGAVSLAAVESFRKKIRGKKTVLIVSGGNIDVNVLSRIIDLGLIRAGRRVRVNVILLDRPGSLAQLTDLIGKQGANVLQAIHDRSEPTAQMNQAEVALTLETRGPEHSAEVIEVLKKQVIRLELGE